MLGGPPFKLITPQPCWGLSVIPEPAKPGVSDYRSRARRYPIAMLLHYRVRDERKWHVATVENISRSGVLFRGDCALEPNKVIEMSLELPVMTPNESPAEVLCAGSVVRIVPALTREQLPTLAATILGYRIVRRESNRSARGAAGSSNAR
jgi:PilZ domain-containing protein